MPKAGQILTDRTQAAVAVAVAVARSQTDQTRVFRTEIGSQVLPVVPQAARAVQMQASGPSSLVVQILGPAP